MNPGRREWLLRLQDRIGHHFADLSLLDRALTHSSRANEALEPGSRHNEPLEFLGDAVLGFVVADMLHRRDPEGDEGTKSRIRARLVSAPSLARRALELGLPELLLLGRGEEKTGGRQKQALWADAYRWKSFLDAGVTVAFGTDWFVEPLDPRLGLYAAVTREFTEGGPAGGFEPQEKISLEDALDAYTRGSAYAELAEDRKGTLAVSKLADLVVFAADLFAIPPREILTTPVDLTVVGGRVVFERKP